MTSTTAPSKSTEGVLTDFTGLHPELVVQRSLKLGEHTFIPQTVGVLFHAPCKIRGVEYTHQGFMRLNDLDSVDILAMVNENPGPSPTTGNERSAVGIFVRPANVSGIVKYASLWKRIAKSGAIYFDGGTERSIGDKVYMKIFKARARAEEATPLTGEDLLGALEGVGSDEAPSGPEVESF